MLLLLLLRLLLITAAVAAAVIAELIAADVAAAFLSVADFITLMQPGPSAGHWGALFKFSFKFEPTL